MILNSILSFLILILSLFFVYVGFKGVKDFFIYPKEKYLKKELPYALIYGCLGIIGFIMLK